MDETNLSSTPTPDEPAGDNPTLEMVKAEVVPVTEEELEAAKKIGAEVETKYSAWRGIRKPFELQWFVNAAYRRGKHTSEAISTLSTLNDISKIDRRKKNIANKLWAKGRARFAKFVKTRPKPIIVPFTHERQDRLNARATERALDYFYEKSEQEQKYSDALLWAQDTGKAYWWYVYDENKIATITQKDPLTQTTTMSDLKLGDIDLEVSSAFEVLAPDLRRTRIGEQPEIMRVRVLSIDDVKHQYPEFEEHLHADTAMTSPFEFERQISHLSGSEAGALASMSTDSRAPKNGVILKEHYTKPNSKFPQGRFITVVNGIAVKVVEELPYGFADLENPYPCSEFIDMAQVGQFYTTTFIEQLIPLQRGYNMLRDKLEMQIRLNVHPKWVVARQARIPKGALTNESSEVVEWNYIPGMPEPHSITPASISNDVWRFANLLKEEFDDISQVYPSFEGKAGKSKSGFQTNLLQEASDNVHSPDARGYELAIRDSAYKLRRMMKQFYDVPRLMSFSARSSIPEVFEFSQDNIDEHALIKVQIGSGLSQFKAARIQQLLEFHEKGLLGDPNDPEVKRRVLTLVDLGGVEEFQERANRDDDMARMENIDMLDGKPVPVPLFYEDHMIHYGVHTDELKSPANKQIDQETKLNMIRHVLMHMKWINPTAAFNLATELGLTDLIENGIIKPPAPPMPGQPQPGAPPQPGQQPQPQPQPQPGGPQA